MNEQAYKNTIASLSLKITTLENALRQKTHDLDNCKNAGLKLADKATELIEHKVKVMADVSTKLKNTIHGADSDILVFSDVEIDKLIAMLDG